MKVRVHNVTDRDSIPRPAKAYRVGKQVIRPGKYADVELSDLARKDRALHGGALYIGTLPRTLAKQSQAGRAKQAKLRAAEPVETLSVQEVAAYLSSLDTDALLAHCDAMVPPLSFENRPPRPTIVTRLCRAIAAGRVLDPEVFYWLGRWDKAGDQYIEKGEPEQAEKE